MNLIIPLLILVVELLFGAPEREAAVSSPGTALDAEVRLLPREPNPTARDPRG